jgi:hypothetical protein
MKEQEIEQLLKMSRELEQFERDCDPRVVTGDDRTANLLNSLAAARAKSAARMRWASVAIAACLVIAVIAKMQSTPTPIVAPEIENAAIEPTQKPTEFQVVQSLPVVPTVSVTEEVPEVKTIPNVQVVVALYRSDSSPTERCPECWCVARWSADWGEGRSVNELQDHELVDDSMMHSCVTDPKHVVVLGLSGPASSMPKNDQQALDLSLCLMGLQGSASPQASVKNPNCTPVGLDYCLTTWGK